MPSYVVTDPDTGVKLKLTGETPPNEEDIANAFKTHYDSLEEKPEYKPKIQHWLLWE